MFLSLPTLTFLTPLASLAGLFSAFMEENFPLGCTCSTSLCFHSLPISIPVSQFFHLWTWMGIKCFRHN
ncbi:phosphatidylinositol N-acetylglucosaminyltransferase subunit Y-like [Neovison vison]|uniref:phosphatidylinositol N-acetylglucosaminyltransferase subunit Y-like n=1 Tax=Neovison vison TaxID=452646 RepID=UPI001CEFC5B3|nr:phosphatidylinositol N-acetylglucosaminyltransferase subunit Y-like [Neogale vison]